ncbi:hypothetical protein Calkr_0689 [Caldicellulosiruptor acetigenus I77R1B]|uniref:DUF5615 domain-containing protein n=2 Tax=Caldicellulosiruptor acetigenus TaxID=301953 RepID=G2PT92_9FIRM|nr:DUF5615 family PIN-like protein [Caldicellulosiruptor acetigenus]ADQ40223.1 hypothetical protein Calkr_0689 [Caldicellulosiruptor acetigenus I77R1B]AEM74251.1 hypothetical protein Calla_1655 [Caldicellulosiruptor acetigenus 6A]
MRFLLDENITPKVGQKLKEFGHDVKDLITSKQFGMKDEEVFMLACKEQRAIITINGRHYIMLIPQRKADIKHYGLIWVRCQITIRDSDKLGEKINELCNVYCSLDDTIFKIKKTNSGDFVYEEYPYAKAVYNQ